MQNIPGLKRPGIKYFRSVLRGSHLLAHTWATRPMLHGVIFISSGTDDPPPMDNYKHYTMAEGFRR